MADACLNCGAGFAQDQKFCGACGQRTDIRPKLTMRDIGHDLAHAITHADHSVFGLIRGLVTRPGHVAREYAEGKRKRHFGPFTFLIISVSIASAVLLITGVDWFAPYEHGDASDLLQRHVNLVILLQTPLMALCCTVLFRRERRSFAEHLVLAAYTSGFHALFLAVVETPSFALLSPQAPDPRLAAVYFAAWLFYFAWAGSQFYSGRRAWSAFKAAVVVVVSQAMTVAVLMAFLYLTTRLASA